MRRFLSILVGMFALVAIAVFATLFAVGYFTAADTAPEPDAVGRPIDVRPSVSEQSGQSGVAVQPAPGAPSISARPEIAPAIGMGGGGRSAYDIGYPAFSSATFRLDATLPTTVPASTVWQLGTAAAWTEAEMVAIAQALGFSGALYTEGMGVVPAAGGVTTDAESAVIMPVDYEAPVIAVDGARRLTFYRGGFSYADPAVDPVRSGRPLLSHEQARPVAETFLRAAGLLQEPYEMRSGWGDEVQFVRQVDGLWLERYFAYVSVSSDGRIAYADYTRLDNLQSTDAQRPTIDARRAYELLTANPTAYGFIYFPGAATRQAGQIGVPTTFSRIYQPGQTAQVNAWLQVLTPRNGGAPLMLLDGNTPIVGDAALLAELATAAYQNVRLTGRFAGTPEALTFEVTSWEVNPIMFDQRLSGTLRRVGGQAVLVINGGLEIALPDAPAALADGDPIAVFGWSIAAGRDGNLPAFDWVSIDRLTAMQGMPEPGYGYDSAELTVTAVDLVLNSTYVGDGLFGEGNYGEQFAQSWRFTTVNEAGDTLIFFVPALELPTP